MGVSCHTKEEQRPRTLRGYPVCGKAKVKGTLFGGGLTTKNKRRKFHKVGSLREIVCVRTGRVSQAQRSGGPGAEQIDQKKKRVSVRPGGQHLTLVKLDLPGPKVGDAKDSIRLRGRRACGYTSQLTRPRGL